jgi:PleD family two-component response regulator
MRSAIGEDGSVYRYGGEEFAALLPATCAEDAADAAERMRTAVADGPIDVRDSADVDELAVTVSVGVAIYDEKTRDDFREPSLLVRAADRAVYRAKQSGRNRTILHEPDAAPEAESETPAAAALGEGRPMRVLIVDDDNLHQKLLTTSLEKTGRAEVRAVESVPAAVKLLHFGDPPGQPYRPDLVVTDLRMPEHCGEKLVRFMRATRSLSTTPVLVLSGSEHDEDVRRCLAAGASAYVPKSALARDPFAAAAKLLDFWSLVAMAA